MSFAMSLIRIRNRRGLLIDHWGTPAYIYFQEEEECAITTLCFRSDKYFPNQCRRSPLMPIEDNL